MTGNSGTRWRRLRRAPAALVLASAIAAAGCASQPKLAPVSVAVIELPPTVDDAALRTVLHGKHDDVDATVLAADRAQIMESLDEAVHGAGCAAAARPPVTAVVRAEAPLPAALGQPLDAAALAQLAALASADAYLRVRVTDFGTTPRRWRKAYVTFEVVTTLGITAALAIKRVTRPLAAAYLIEESVEELGEGYAGFWALNRLSRPVRIEADLIDAHSGNVLWRGARTGLSRWRWRNLRHMDASRRDELLASSSCRSADAIFKALAPPTH